MAASWLLLLPLSVLLSCRFTVASSNVYIVYMGHKHHDEPQLAQESHHQILSTVLGSKEAAMESILYSYKHGFSGFAAVLTQSQSKIIADSPGVARVVRNKIHSLHTTRSWDFLQLKPYKVDGIVSRSRSGVGSIIGIMDTGIWPESESFNDVDMREVPSTWKGICQEGEGFNHSNCNRKIIGARWYIKGYEAEFGNLNTSGRVEFLSPRDAVGHGTHTSSTACGTLVENASFMGLARGRARGGAPSASVAIYKVCWSTGGCSSADLLAAFDDAILDGVDLLSISLGSSPPLETYVDDVVAIGSFHAVTKGIAVVCSAGNSGPFPQTVINTAPWIITVAASTIDRGFPTLITLGNNQTLLGQGLYTGKKLNKLYPIVYGEDIASTDADEDSARSQSSASFVAESVKKARGVGLIFAQFPTKDISLYSAVLPSVQVDLTMATTLLSYMESTRNPVVKFSGTRTSVGQQISPEVAFFSSRGPSSLSPSVLKPDVAAPGVNILASWSPASSQNAPSPLNFKIESGTSMSCPHISGIIALLKAIHPTWSPAAMKSALVTTASLQDEFGQSIVAEGAPYKQADSFDYGGGHVDPNRAIDPGLVFDMGTSDYARFLCSMGYNHTAVRLMTHASCHPSTNHANSKQLLNLNLPSIAIPELKRSLKISRTVTNVGPARSVYASRVQAPPGTDVMVDPPVLSFNSSAKKLKFKVTFRPLMNVEGRYSFGNLLWEDGLHAVRIPLAVKTVIS